MIEANSLYPIPPIYPGQTTQTACSTPAEASGSSGLSCLKNQNIQDKISLSSRSQELCGKYQGKYHEKEETSDTPPTNGNSKKQGKTSHQFSQQGQLHLQKLRARDIEVRTHEQAHLANAGQYAMGGARYEFQQGPDGKKYAVSGEVSIDISKANSPEETIEKMQKVRKAALAPASPSAADRAVAAKASTMEARTKIELKAEISNSFIPAENPLIMIENEESRSPDWRQDTNPHHMSLLPLQYTFYPL